MTKLAQLESLIFVAGDEGITLSELAALTLLTVTEIKTLLNELAVKYDSDQDCSLELLKSDTTYRLATKTNLAPLVKKFFEAPLSTHLTQASLEVLAIIAYRQPVTRIEIDEIRGVQSSSIIQKLQLRNLITDVGRKNEPGRPIMYGTSSYFLDYFALATIDDLPSLTTETSFTGADEMSGDLFLSAFNKRIQESQETTVTPLTNEEIPFA